MLHSETVCNLILNKLTLEIKMNGPVKLDNSVVSELVAFDIWQYVLLSDDYLAADVHLLHALRPLQIAYLDSYNTIHKSLFYQFELIILQMKIEGNHSCDEWMICLNNVSILRLSKNRKACKINGSL